MANKEELPKKGSKEFWQRGFKKLSKPLFKRGGVKSRLRRRKKSGGLNKVQKDRALRSLGNF